MRAKVEPAEISRDTTRGRLTPSSLNRTLLSLTILNLAKCCTYEPSVPRVHITEARTPAPRHATPQGLQALADRMAQVVAMRITTQGIGRPDGPGSSNADHHARHWQTGWPR